MEHQAYAIGEKPVSSGYKLGHAFCRYILSVPIKIGPGGIVTCTLIEESVSDLGGGLCLSNRTSIIIMYDGG